MSYKGGDLDMLCVGTAQPREVTEVGERPLDPGWGQLPAAGASPIAVDEVVLASCNRAFDIAQFHAAGSVRPEHLLHALTRVDAATTILADLGIRADVLRRDTAIAIASEMPGGVIDAPRNPRASSAFAEALRRAAVAAYARRQPAGVRDVVRAVLLAGPDAPGAALLMRAAIDPARLDRWRDEPRREALPSAQLVRTEPPPAPPATEMLVARFEQVHTSMQTLREEAAADRKAVGELLRAMKAELQGWRAEAVQATEAAQAARAAGDLVRTLKSDVQAWRAEAVQAAEATQAALAARSAAAGLVPASGADRSAAIEAVLEAKLGEFAGAMAALAARLGAVDKLADGDPWNALGARLEAVEGSVAGQGDKLADMLASALALRRQEEQARQTALEASIRSHVLAAEEAQKASERELRRIHGTLEQLGIGHHSLSEGIAAWQSESSGDISVLSNRLQRLDRSALDQLDRLGGEVQALRQDFADAEARRNNSSFKRWLFGTDNVFATSWREEFAAARARLRPGDKS